MSNLDSAKAGIKTELAHAKEGLAYYQGRVASLENMLKQVLSLGDDSTTASGTVSTATGKRGRKPGTKLLKPTMPAKVAKADGLGKATKIVKGGKAKTAGNDLPFTGGTFWQDLVTSEPKSVSEIMNAAISSFGFTPTKEQVKKLANRQTFALNTLVKTKVIQDSGKGRERRFFKA